MKLYSIFDLLFDAPSYRPVYVISESEMKELKKTKHQNELNGIINQKKNLEEAYKGQLKHLEEKGKELKKELKVIGPSNKKV